MKGDVTNRAQSRPAKGDKKWMTLYYLETSGARNTRTVDDPPLYTVLNRSSKTLIGMCTCGMPTVVVVSRNLLRPRLWRRMVKHLAGQVLNER